MPKNICTSCEDPCGRNYAGLSRTGLSWPPIILSLLVFLQYKTMKLSILGLIIPPKILHSNHPIRGLLLSFLTWKTTLLVIAAASPGPGYDTSASLSGSSGDQAGELPTALRYFVENLTKWDAIYFVQSRKPRIPICKSGFLGGDFLE